MAQKLRRTMSSVGIARRAETPEYASSRGVVESPNKRVVCTTINGTSQAWLAALVSEPPRQDAANKRPWPQSVPIPKTMAVRMELWMAIATRDHWMLPPAGARAIEAFLPDCAHAKAPTAGHGLPGLRHAPNGLVCAPLSDPRFPMARCRRGVVPPHVPLKTVSEGATPPHEPLASRATTRQRQKLLDKGPCGPLEVDPKLSVFGVSSDPRDGIGSTPRRVALG